MITLYPSNRLEDLAELLMAVLSHRQGSILAPDQILVESRGMQHWLNLQLSARQGVAMNLQFPMPSRFTWELARTLLGGELVPLQSPYRREVLSWRIDAHLQSADFIADPLSVEVSRYWGGEGVDVDPLKRFQLAEKLADLYEQYLLFRPDWLEGWERGELKTDSSGEPWQALLWRRLVAEHPLHPANLQKMAIEAMAEHPEKLPRQVLIFAINTLAPQTLAFFEALSQYTQVHLFHLNPCATFWGELHSDRALAKRAREQQLAAWLDDESLLTGNPLLANLGQQGREFFNLLQEVKGVEISAFELDGSAAPGEGVTLLHALQRDILNLNDNRTTPENLQDESVTVRSCHSALREIQVLHDYLLHQFNSDPSLTPQDILVMCPAIEQYAPYIDAVFRRPWEQDEGSVRLPCSIADRTLMDAEPLIAAYLELLTLPDSRFELSKILDFLRLPALQSRFGFVDADLELMEWWLQEACVHWGVDGEHRARMADLSERNATFSWQWGLERLLLGFAMSDSEVVSDNLLLLPHVEGNASVLLGRMMQLLERLQYHAAHLQRARTPAQWQSYLLTLRDELFAPIDEERDAFELITSCIGQLSESCHQADYGLELSLPEIRHYLQNHFARADSGNHFLTGQITFCSMVPMRSIPFRVIAILGLNDGQFPRQSTPLGFDLMAQSPRRAGDRSRRGDDRYLFLEALISVREKLYLSYQGRDIRNNGERQPSLILKELLDYLQQGYGWSDEITAQPLHPFSPACFSGGDSEAERSFDPGWLRLTAPSEPRSNQIELPPPEPMVVEIELDTLVSCFANPLAFFARKRLGLELGEQTEIAEDAEPFEVSALTEFKLRSALAQEQLSCGSGDIAALRYQLSGELPQTPLTNDAILQNRAVAEEYCAALQSYGELEICTVEWPVGELLLRARLPLADDKLLLARPAAGRAPDLLRFWLMHLICCASGKTKESRALFLVKNKQGEREPKSYQLAKVEPDEAQRHLETFIASWQKALCQPCLLHAELGKALFTVKGDLDELQGAHYKAWQESINGNFFLSGLMVDPYFQWFYPAAPELDSALFAALSELYLPLYQSITEVNE